MDSGVAIITGAGGGIGRAACLELSRLGYRLVLCGRTTRTLEESAELVKNAIVVPTDVMQPVQVQAVVEKAVATFGRIDVIVNNAGIAPALGIEATSIEQFHAVIDTNLSGAFYLSKAVWPIFKSQGGGVIVNISSLASRDPLPGFLAYGAAKGGLNLLGLSLAREGATIGIRVHTVAPGGVETALMRSLWTPEQLPPHRAMDPMEVARVIGQCVSGDLKHTSGEVIWMHK